MKEMRRVLALVLCMVMLVGIIPANAFATEDDVTAEELASAVTGEKAVAEESEEQTPSAGEIQQLVSAPEAAPTVEANNNVDYLFIATDRHANTSVIGDIINNMESNIGDNELDYLALGGDMVGSSNSHPSYNSSTILDEVTTATGSLNASNVDLVAGIHDVACTDDAGILLPYGNGGGLLYSGDKFYVYGVEEYCISEDYNYSDSAMPTHEVPSYSSYSDKETQFISVQAQNFIEWANSADVDKSKVIVVVSHYPLHNKRDDNDGAYIWHQALNTVATGAASDDTTVERNILFFHGHNHTKDSNEYVYNVGDTMSIQNGSGTTSEPIYYTYATAGYLNQNKKATLVTITDKAIALNKYTTSGSGTAMASVDRVVVEEEVTLTSIAVTGTTEYTVGGNGLELTVTAYYDDGTDADVTAEATFEPAELTVSGKHTITANYQGMTDTIDVTVALYDEVLNDNGDLLIGVEAISQGATALEVTWDDDADAILYENGLYTDYVVYDLAMTNPGETTEYAMSLVDNMDTTNLVVYHVADDGTLTKVEHKIEDDCVVFTTSLTGTFAYGTIAVPEGYTLDSITLAGIPTDLFVGGSLDLLNAVITATYIKDDAENFVRVLTVYDYDENNFSGFDVNVAGKQTAVFTFEGVEATLDIHVWGEEFTVDGVTVHVGEDEYGVTNAVVSGSNNENVDTAVAGLLEEGSYTAYEISLSFAEGYVTNDKDKTVTLPVPEGVTKPAVYYVSADGAKVEKMPATVSENGTTVTFTTTHFSTYVVGESTEITVPDEVTATGSGTTTTTEEKEVYVLVSSISAAGDYLISNTNSATTSAHLLTASSNGVTDTSNVTIKTGTDADGNTVTYIENPNTNAIWTASANGSGYTLYNSGQKRYLRVRSSEITTTSGTSNASTMIGSNNTLYRSSDNYYVYYSTSGWSRSNSSQTVYIYQKQTVNLATTTTVSGTYSIAGEDETVAAIKDATVDLSANLLFNGEVDEDVSATATYEVYKTDTVNGDPLGVISGISGNTVTLSGEVGNALVKVSYITDFGEVTNYIHIIARAPIYSVAIDGAPETSQLKLNTTLTLEGIVSANGEALTGDAYKVTWSTSDANIADVNENGVVTAKAEGEVTITATWTDPNGTEHTASVTMMVVDTVYDLELCAPTYTEAVGVTADNFASGTYFTLENNGYVKATAFEEGVTYYIQGDTYLEAEVADETAFEEGTYYVLNDGVFTLATSYDSNAEYYVMNAISKPIVVKDVEANQTYTNVWAVITKDGADVGALTAEELAKLTFISSNNSIATIEHDTGKVTFTGNSGTVVITAIYEYAEGKSVTDAVVFSISADHYYVPEDGTDDFREYPTEGAVRFDKTATAVGNFSQTGIAKVELSMTGVPFTTGNELDVVLMIDLTGSMLETSNNVVTLDRITPTAEAAQAFVDSIVKNTDGTFNKNRVAVYAFHVNRSGSGNNSTSTPTTDEIYALGTVTESNYNTVMSKLTYDALEDLRESGGTPYATALSKCEEVLRTARAAEGYSRKQYCVFMTDGCPTTYQYSESASYSTTNIQGMFTGTNHNTRADGYMYEYYSTKMKSDGVTVYSVGLGLNNENSAWSGWDAIDCFNAAKILLNDISGPANETDIDTGTELNKFYTGTAYTDIEGKYFFSVDDDNADKMSTVFKSIAQKILDAAKDVKVTDQISDDFTMVFDFPNSTVEGAVPDGQEFYIEVLDYQLVPVYTEANITKFEDNVTYYTKSGNTYTQVTGAYQSGTTYYTITDYNRGTATSKVKLYIGNNDGTYYAATAYGATGGSNAYAAPTFNQTALGSKFYWTTVQPTENYSGVSVTVDGTTYYFVTEGISSNAAGFVQANWYNMASGAYAYGTPTVDEYQVSNDDGTDTETRTSTTCQNLIIATPYFVYNASSKMLVWTIDKLTSSELALSYFLYLDKSAGYEGSSEAAEPESYKTNEAASMTYTNFQGNECEVTFPVPQVTWNGAQVSYVFYLVNDQGQPVNRAGRVVPFSEAVYVTDVFTYSIVWNRLEQSAGLEAERLAAELVPSVYALYDKGATYKIHVYENENYVNLNNHFVIGAGESTYTTYVFNAKADAEKYSVPGTYVAYNSDTATTKKPYMCKDYENVSVTWNADGTIASASYSGSYTQLTPPDSNSAPADFTDSNNHVYYIDDEGEVYTIVHKYDGTETYNGFDFSNTTVAFAVVWKPELVEDTVVIDFGLDVVIDVTSNDALASGVVGVRTDAPAGIQINGGTYTAAKAISADIKRNDTVIATASVESLSSVRVSLNKENSMLLDAPFEFYYETDVNYYIGANMKTTSMYSKVTVIPATTVYYEDEYVTLKTYSKYVEDANVTAENFAEGTYYTKTANGAYVVATEFAENTKYYTHSDSYTEIAGWDVNSVAANQTQQVDRPGVSMVGSAYDADNVYGYDAAYENSSTYSLGNSAMTRVVNGESYATAEFEFYGTGFDILSLTSNTTGTIIVRVYPWDDTAKDYSSAYDRSHIVDTYYGYTYGKFTVTYTYDADEKVWKRTVGDAAAADAELTEADLSDTAKVVTAVEMTWKATKNNPEGLYQVPVMKVDGLDYGRYKAVITCSYASMFDHDGDGTYDFYLDAIRIYDPCGTDDDTANGAYEEDGELDPIYKELRNEIIATSTIAEFFAETKITKFADGVAYYTKENNVFTIAEAYAEGTTYYTMASGVEVDGAAFLTGTFIDGNPSTTSISDYTNYGPNNEVYLAAGQAVAAKMVAPAKTGNYETRVYLGIKSVGGNASVEVYGLDANGKETAAVKQVLATATDMYYDISALNGKTVVIRNSGTEGIVSVTNVKVAYEKVEPETESLDAVTVDAAAEGEEEAMFTVSSDTLKLALLSMREPIEEEPVIPEGSEPDSSEPEGSEPEGSEPDGSEPDGSEPEGSEPEGSEPNGSEPEGSEPDSSEPAESKPEESVPGEPTTPEETEPEEKESIEETVRDIIEIVRDIIGIIGGFFGGWF